MRRVSLLLAASLFAFAPLLDAAPSPRIVNGSVTGGFASVGALLMQDTNDPDQLDGLCSGTLIGCRTFLTAAHCVCPESTENAAGCLREGTTDPATLRVFLPNAGILTVQSVAINPLYSFAERGDSAVVRLSDPVGGIAPSAINRVGRLPDGTQGTIVGFGTTGGPPFLPSDYGVKRDGKITTGACADDVVSSTHVCWSFAGTEASTCSGDSGGPLFVDLGDGPVVAGITSGGESFSCEPPDQVFDTDVYVARDWIEAQLTADTTESCDDLPLLGTAEANTASATAALTSVAPELKLDFNVPFGTRLLRIALNGQEISGEGFHQVENDFDLFGRADSTPAEELDCLDTTPGVYGACEIASPAVGSWHVTATRVEGSGTAQITVTLFAGDSGGDTNCDSRHGAADLVALAQLVGAGAPLPCAEADADGDGQATPADLDPALRALFPG